MAVITNSTAFTIAAQSTAAVTTDVEVIAAGAAGTGNGRLVHPTLGTFDYLYMPEQWTNMDGSAIIFPNWQSSKTLGAGQNTLWGGVLKDTECTETWTAPGGLAMPMDMLRLLLDFFQNPPDPTVDYVQWYPSYITTLGFDVVIKNLQVGGRAITFTDISLQGWIDQPVSITYQLIQAAA